MRVKTDQVKRAVLEHKLKEIELGKTIESLVRKYGKEVDLQSCFGGINEEKITYLLDEVVEMEKMEVFKAEKQHANQERRIREIQQEF